MDIDAPTSLVNGPQILEQTGYSGHIIPPYKRIPAELVKEIISCCVREGRLTLRKDDPRIQVTQICSTWRHVAFNISELWNMHLGRICGEYTVNLLAAWLRQCTNTHISLTMSHEDLTLSSYGSLFVTEVVIPNARRFKALSCPEILPGQWRSLQFDSLTTLYLLSSPFPTYENEKLNAPSLRTLGIIRIAQNYAVETGTWALEDRLPKIPWEQLTSIELTGTIPFVDIYWILSDSTSLEKCVVNSSYHHSDRSVTDLPVVKVPNLKDLEISFVSSEDCNALLHIDPPNLVSLKTNGMRSSQPNRLLPDFLWARVETLRHFTIIPANFCVNYIPSLMYALPLVTHFSAGREVVNLSGLARIGSRQLLPYVEVLEFAACSWETISDVLDALLPLEGDKPQFLKEITIAIDSKAHQRPEKRIEDLRSQGITINLIERTPMVYF